MHLKSAMDMLSADDIGDRFFFRILISTLLLCNSSSFAQETAEDLSQQIDTYSRAELKEAIPPDYPWIAERSGREGWVVLSYVVTVDGEIEEAMIEDSSGGEDFELAALRMLEMWEYKPALLNGVAIDQSMTNYRVVFQMEDSSSGAGRKFRRAYREIQELISAQKLEEADLLLSDLQFTEKQNLYEDAWLWWLKYQYLKAAGEDRTFELLDSLRKAIGYEEVYLPADIFVFASQELYVLQAKELDFGGAIRTYERLKNTSKVKRSEFYDQVLSGLEPSYEDMQDVIAGDKTLSLGARVGVNGYWVHHLLRRTFSLGDISGDLELIDIRCSRRYRKYSISESTRWTIPASWGSCGVYVKGEEGSTFRFYEHPNGN